VLSRTTSGNVTINGTIMHIAQDDLPFGGVGASGMGAYHGVEGFRALSHAKGIFEQGRWNSIDFLRAPSGAAPMLFSSSFSGNRLPESGARRRGHTERRTGPRRGTLTHTDQQRNLPDRLLNVRV
jgi:hypothetical protein